MGVTVYRNICESVGAGVTVHMGVSGPVQVVIRIHVL